MLYSEVYTKRIRNLCGQHEITLNRLAAQLLYPVIRDYRNRLPAADKSVIGGEPWSHLENLPRKLQFLLGRESFVELFHIAISHVISLRRLIYTGDAVQVSTDQFFAENE